MLAITAAIVTLTACFLVINWTMDADAKRKGGEKVAAQAGVALQEFHQWHGAGDVQAWKLALVNAYLAHGKVIWVDEELGRWKGPSVDRPNLVCLNWRAALVQGGVISPAAQG